MASLTLGPRLGCPSSTGFSVWAQTDSAATVTLQTRKYGLTAWTTQDSDDVDTDQYNTVVLAASGLSPRTRYDYRLLVDDVEAAVAYTYTMPGSGRFVVYHIADEHGVVGTTDSYAQALTDWQTNYEPNGIPAFMVQMGDIYVVTASTIATVMSGVVASGIPEMAGVGKAAAYLPVIYMFDDWDWAGNNSSSNRLAGFVSEPDPLAAAFEFYRIMWRDQPEPASPSLAYSVEVAGIPFIVTDQRSQRTQSGYSPYADGHDGSEPFSDTYTVFGSAQRAWLIEQLRTYADRGMVVLVSGGSFKTQVVQSGTQSFVVGRDSIGLWFKAERNYVLREGCIGRGYDWRHNLIVWSGDDHHNSVSSGGAHEPPLPYNTPTAQLPGSQFGVPFREFKVGYVSTNADMGRVYGHGDLFEAYGDAGEGEYNNYSAIVRWDITSTDGGRYVTARATYIHTVTTETADAGDTVVANQGPAAGESGDFYFCNGLLQYYDRNDGSQTYPPDSGPGGVRFERTYIDDITGLPVKEHGALRDYEGALRDIEELDKPASDELREGWEPPTEHVDPRLQ